MCYNKARFRILAYGLVGIPISGNVEGGHTTIKIKIWGARGSIPSPLKPEEVRDKIQQAILSLPEIDVKDPAAVEAYLNTLPPLLSGTAGGNTTCVEIQAGQDIFIIDAGSGLRELGLSLMQGPCGRGEGKLHFLFTHTHWDHLQGFPMFFPAFIPGNRITVYSVHDVESSLKDQQRFVNWPVSLAYMKAHKEFVTIQPGQPFKLGPVEINLIETVHPGQAFAYRFADAHSIFVFASDAEYKKLDKASLRPFINFYRDADLLYFDAMYTLKEAWQRIDFGHSSAMIGADIARAAGVKRLLLGHHDPTYSDADLLKIQQETIAYQAQDTTRPACEVIVAYEGLTIDLAPPRQVNLDRFSEDEERILTSSGSFDESGIAQLEQQLDQLKEIGSSAGLIIDLSQTETLTTTGLQRLVTLYKERMDTTLVLAAPSPQVRQVIELAGFMDYFAIYPTVEAAHTALQAAAALNLRGQLIKDRYQIERKLGDSRQGAVFKAIDTQQNYPVAIIVLSPSFGQKAIEKIMVQAGLTLTMDHRHITPVLDCGQDQGLSFIVEEFMEAQSLRQVMRQNMRQALPVDQAREISLSILSALEYAHSRGMIHTNLAPRNIFLADPLKLSNFGLGRLEEGRPLAGGPLALLEAPYLAPEQILGHTPDARTDLYALGTIMYELFTGRPPFIGVDQEVMQAQLYQLPTPPSELNPAIFRPLEYLILKLLAKNSDDRFATAHETYHILSSLAVDGADDTALAKLLRDLKPLVNRLPELNQMEQVRETVLQSGLPQFLIVRGEMGIGKSRLVAEFLLRCIVDQKFTVVVGHCDEFGTPYTPYAEILTTIFSRGLIDPQNVADQAKHLMLQIPNLAAVLSPYQVLAPRRMVVNPQRAQWHFFETVSQLLSRLGPTLLFLEDATFLDEASIALTRFLIRRGQFPLLIVAAGRDDEEANPWLKAFQADEKRVIALEPLANPDIELYLANLIGGTISPAALATIGKRTHGNPYFINEISQHMMAHQALQQRASGEWVYHPEKATEAMPPALMDLFSRRMEKLAKSRRIEDLSEPAHEALAVAALIGPEFNIETWMKVLQVDQQNGGSQIILALDALDEALGLQLLRQVEEGRYIFDSEDLAEVLLSYLSNARQRDLHLQIAEILSERQENPITISHHYERAGFIDQAARYLEIAGTKAIEMDAIGEAIIYFNQAVTLAESQSGYEALGNLYRQKGAAAESIQVFQRALELAKQANDLAGQARILNGLTLVSWLYDRYQDAAQAAKEVLNLAGVPNIELATARSHLGMIAWVMGDLDEAESWCRQAASLLEAGENPTALAGVYNRLGLVYLFRGNFAEAEGTLQRALALRQQVGDDWGQAYCLNNLGRVALDQGRVDQARRLLAQAQQIFEGIDSPDGLMAIFTNEGRTLLRQGQAGEALSILYQALAQAKKINQPSAYYLGDVYLLIAQASLQAEDLQRARAAVDKALKLVETAGNMELVASGEAILAQIHAAEGDEASATTLFQSAIATLETVGSPATFYRTQLHYARFLAGHGQKKAARTLERTVRQQAAAIKLDL